MSRRRAPSYPRRTLLLVALVSLLSGVLLGGWLVSLVGQPAGGAVDTSSGADPSPRPKHRRTVIPRPEAFPVRLEIAAIDLATPLVRLGLMPDRTVQVPTNPDRAGWFQPGPLPGRRGSAVILGHVDSTQGPAVFARLQELRPGDAVTVDRADGSTVRFVVRRSVLYANSDFPAHRVYAAQGGRRLNLVTCGGAYDSTRGGYQSNLVVYARRASPSTGPTRIHP